MARNDYLVYNNSARVTSVFLKIIEKESSVSMSLLENGYVTDFLKGVGKLFYIVNPAETTYEDPRDVPPYFADVSCLWRIYHNRITCNFELVLSNF